MTETNPGSNAGPTTATEPQPQNPPNPRGGHDIVPERSPEREAADFTAALNQAIAGGSLPPALLAELGAPVATPTPAQAPAAPVPVASPAAPAPPVSAPQTATQAPAPVTPSEPSTVPVTEEEGSVEEEAKPKQFRLRPRNETDVALFEALKANPFLSAEEALAKIKASQAPETPAAAMAPSVPEPALPEGTPKSSAEVMKAIAEARKARDEASANADFEAETAANARYDSLVEALPQVQAYESQVRSVQSQAVRQEFDAAIKQAEDLYPDFSDPNSEFSKAVESREAEAKLADDPVFHNPRKALLLAREVAKDWANQGKIVRRKGEALPPAQPAPPVAPVAAAPAKPASPVVHPIAPASASASDLASPSVLSDLDAIRNPKDLDAFLARFGVHRGFATS